MIQITKRAAAALPPDRALPGINLLALAGSAKAPEPRQLIAELTLRRGVDEPLWMDALIDERQQTIVQRAGAEGWSAERFDLLDDPRERAPALRIDAATPEASEVLDQLDHARRELHRLRAIARLRVHVGADIQASERDELSALGYGGGAKRTTFGVERLCFDGCIWRP